MRPYVFISHAATDDSDQQVLRFQHDLRRELGRQLGYDGWLDSGADGYREDAFTLATGGAHPGVPGAPGLPGSAASTPAMSCRCLVALYSAEYTRSAHCTYDRQVFEERMTWQAHRTGRTSGALVRVVWDAGGLPAEAADGPGWLPAAAGGDYPRRGVSQLMRDPSAHGGYHSLVRRVAERVARSAGRPPPPMTPRDIGYFARTAHSPFAVAPPPRMRLPSATPRWQTVDALPAGQTSVAPGTEGSRWELKRTAERPDPPTRPRSWFTPAEEAQRPILRGPHM